MLVLLTRGMLSLAFNIQPAKSEWTGTVYIRADGSIDPPDAPIQRDGNVYTLTGNITSNADGIVVERDNIVIDGLGHLLQGPGSHGIDLSSGTNITVKNLQITKFSHGVWLNRSINCVISRNNITNNQWTGVVLLNSSNNTIEGNTVVANINVGIQIDDSSNNILSGNNITNNSLGLWLIYSSNNTVSANNITNNTNAGVQLSFSPNNTVLDNRFVNDGLIVRDDSRLWKPRSKSYFNVVEGNLVNGKPLIYLEGASNLALEEEEAGQVILVHCSGIRVENLSLSNTTVGIQLWQTNNTIIRNNVVANNRAGIQLDTSSNNNISRNSITNDAGGIWLGYSSNYNSIYKNEITTNGAGIRIWDSGNNVISGNNITNNEDGICLSYKSSNNKFYHNNFIDNIQQAYIEEPGYANVWDDGYPSGGNYWSDYNGTDFYSGPYQNETGSDGIGDTPYIIDENNQDHYPLMRTWPPQEHELNVSLTAPTYLQLGGSIWLNATVKNEGLNNETSVRLSLLINSTTANSTTIPLLRAGSSYTLTYPWTPTAKGTYNVTAYVEPVSGETSIENNQMTKIVTVSPPPEVGVKAGDWIKIDYTVSGWPSGQPYPEWLKVEFLTVEGINITVCVTMHMSDGTEQSDTVPVIVGAGGGEAFGLSGFVIPANLTIGDSVYISGYGNVTLAGETTRTYAGASRTVVYASFSQYGTQLTYYWDKQTGVMVEASTTSGSVTATAKATETNMWQAAPSGFPIEPIHIIAQSYS